MANLVRRSPLSLLRDGWGDIFDEPFFRGFIDPEEGTLPLDISQEGENIIVRASLPGYKKENLDIQINNGVLTITAKHEEESETKDERFYRKERRMGSVSRRVALPGIVDEEKAHADLKEGVLTLRIPVSEKAKPKLVKID